MNPNEMDPRILAMILQQMNGGQDGFDNKLRSALGGASQQPSPNNMMTNPVDRGLPLGVNPMQMQQNPVDRGLPPGVDPRSLVTPPMPGAADGALDQIMKQRQMGQGAMDSMQGQPPFYRPY